MKYKTTEPTEQEIVNTNSDELKILIDNFTIQLKLINLAVESLEKTVNCITDLLNEGDNQS